LSWPFEYFVTIFFVTGSCIVAQAGLKLANFLLSLPNAGITGMLHYAWLDEVLKMEYDELARVA
jgi:hypothetical protein